MNVIKKYKYSLKLTVKCFFEHQVLITFKKYTEKWKSHTIIIIIIIIKKDRQCKAEREWYTPYQSEHPSPTIPTYRQKEEKGKKSRRI